MLARFHIRTHTTILAALVLVVAIAATAASARVSGQAAKPQRGGTLTLALNAGWDNLDPALTAFTFSRQIMKFIYDPLVTRDPKTGEIIPNLAQSWTISKDKKTVTLKLRRGVRFQDGTPFNAAAVVFSFNRIISPKDELALRVDDHRLNQADPRGRELCGPACSKGTLRTSVRLAVAGKPCPRLTDCSQEVGQGLRCSSGRHRPLQVRQRSPQSTTWS